MYNFLLYMLLVYILQECWLVVDSLWRQNKLKEREGERGTKARHGEAHVMQLSDHQLCFVLRGIFSSIAFSPGQSAILGQEDEETKLLK